MKKMMLIASIFVLSLQAGAQSEALLVGTMKCGNLSFAVPPKDTTWNQLTFTGGQLSFSKLRALFGLSTNYTESSVGSVENNGSCVNCYDANVDLSLISVGVTMKRADGQLIAEQQISSEDGQEAKTVACSLESEKK